jgi:DNA-binding IscR family transcriptional regulator
MKLRAQEWLEMLQTGEVVSRTQIARREGVSRAYVTKVLKLIKNN